MIQNEPLAVVILAAGLGKRMGSSLPKVMSAAAGKPLIQYVVGSALELNPQKVILVTGHKRELVESFVTATFNHSDSALRFAQQTEQRGTGDAVKSALSELAEVTGTVLILYGDVPLLRSQTLQQLLSLHREQRATLSFISVVTPEPDAYGRVIRDSAGKVLGIREARDCSCAELMINEINSGIYAVDSSFLPGAIESLKNENAQKEYYLTDIVEKAVSEGQNVSTLVVHSMEELQGVNTVADLSLVEQGLRRRRVQVLIQQGVIVKDPATFYPDEEVVVSPGVVIGPNVTLEGATSIAPGVRIEGTAVLRNCNVAENVEIRFSSHLEDASIGAGSMVGPFARIRPGTVVGADAKIGNFVEIKSATVGTGAKVSHLSYIGDATIGEESNIGAGTITCNYDGYKKSRTTVGKGVFIGSNTALVAPVTIEDGATVGAGSVITSSVPSDALALTRPELEVREGWSRRKREAAAKKSK